MDGARCSGRQADQASNSCGSVDDFIGAALSKQMKVLLFAPARNNMGSWVELAHGKRDQDCGVVAVRRHYDRTGTINTGLLQHGLSGGVASDCHKTSAFCRLDRDSIAVNYDHTASLFAPLE